MGFFAWRPAFSEALRGKQTVNPKNFFAELKRRNVDRIVLLLVSTQQPQNDMKGRNDAGYVDDCACASLQHGSGSTASHL
jgi:hypothetical protein